MSGVDGYNPLPSDSQKEARDKDRTGEALRATVPDWIRGGSMLKDLKATVGSTLKVPHGLKRKPSGWLLVRPRLTGAVGSASNDRSLLEVSSDASSLTLQCLGGGGTLTFDLWVW